MPALPPIHPASRLFLDLLKEPDEKKRSEVIKAAFAERPVEMEAAIADVSAQAIRSVLKLFNILTEQPGPQRLEKMKAAITVVNAQAKTVEAANKSLPMTENPIYLPSIDAMNDKHATVLELAVEQNDRSMTELLVNAGANINTSHSTPLMRAAFQGSYGMVKYLIEAKADIHTCGDYHGNNERNALMMAVLSPNLNPDVVGLLLQHKAAKEKKDRWSNTAISYASNRTHPKAEECVRILKTGIWKNPETNLKQPSQTPAGQKKQPSSAPAVTVALQRRS